MLKKKQGFNSNSNDQKLGFTINKSSDFGGFKQQTIQAKKKHTHTIYIYKYILYIILYYDIILNNII